MDTSTSYVVQFFYQGDYDQNDTLESIIRGGVSWSSQVLPVYINPDLNSNIGPAWTKYAGVVTTADSGIPDYIVGIVRVNNIVVFYIDDFVIYEDTIVDITSPDDPLFPIAMQTDSTDELMVFWDPPLSGVDGGGYLVTRTIDSVTSVSAAPVINGIYTMHNFIGGAEVVYIGTETSFFDQGLIPDTFYYYRIFTVDKAFNYYHGVTPVTTYITDNYEIRYDYTLGQNYPNPFNPSTRIEFAVKNRVHTLLIVYDALGNEVQKLFNSVAEPGKVYELLFDASGYSSGFYFYKIIAGNYKETRKMLLIK